MSAEKLAEFLRTLPDRLHATEVGFMIDIGPAIAELLGFEHRQLFFQPAGRSGRLVADAAISDTPDTIPWIVIEFKNYNQLRVPMHWLVSWEEALSSAQKDIGAPKAVLLSPTIIIIIDGSRRFEFRPAEVDTTKAEQILSLIGKGAVGPAQDRPPPSTPTNESIDTTFRLTRGRLRTLLDKVTTAVTSVEKGASLEELAAALLGSATFMRVKHRNLQTASAEIDLVIEVTRRKAPSPWDDLGRQFIVECKNWAEPIAAKHVRDLVGKLQSTRLMVALLFARAGVTGAHGGADALWEVRRAFDSNGHFVIVVSLADLDAAADSASFAEIIDTRIDQLRFNIA